MRWLGLLLAVLVGAVAALVAVKSPLSILELWSDPCRGFCAQGVTCHKGRCVAMERPAAFAPRPKKAKSRKRRARSRGGTNPVKLPWTKDRHVPRFDPHAIQKIQAGDESGRLDQMDIDAALAKLQPAWERCVERADTRAQGQLAEGRVHLSFGVSGAGKVTGVNARAPKALAKFGIVPCVRVAVFGARFPAYKGPDTRVESHFDVAF